MVKPTPQTALMPGRRNYLPAQKIALLDIGSYHGCRGELSLGELAFKGISLIDLASPKISRVRMPHQLKSTSYQARPCLAKVGCAWWLLCSVAGIACDYYPDQ